MIKRSRKEYYRRCQEIIDDLHVRVSKGECVTEEHCKRLYGTSDYNALLHELRLMNADTDMTVMTPAMEWLYKSRHFKHKARGESRESLIFICTILSVVAVGFSAYFAGCSRSTEVITPRNNEYTHTTNNVNNADSQLDKIAIDPIGFEPLPSKPERQNTHN